MFVDALVRDLCTSMTFDQVRSISKSLGVLANVKQQEEKPKNKKTKTRSGPKKTSGFTEEQMGMTYEDDLEVDELDPINGDGYDDEYDFM